MDSPLATPKHRSPTELHHQIRILCPSSRTGAVIGRGGSSVRLIQSLTGAKVRLLDDHYHHCEDRVILITNPNPPFPKPQPPPPPPQQENQQPHDSNTTSKVTEEEPGGGGGEEEGWSPVQKALARVFEKVIKGDSEEELGEDVCVVGKVLVGFNQAGALLGRGGKALERISIESGTQIRVLPPEQMPPIASPGDELILVTGSFSAVRKALLSVSSCIQDNTRVDKPLGMGLPGTNMPANGDLPQRGHPHGLHPLDHHSRGYSPNMGPENGGVPKRMVFEEEVVFKLLCQCDRVGNLIGKGGSSVRLLENETGASIKVAEAVPDSDERVVVIASRENSEQRHSPAQDAVIRVHSRITEIGSEHGAPVVARLLVHSQQVGRLMGRGGQMITEMRQVTGAGIRIFPREHSPKYSTYQNEEIVQVIGSLRCVQDALFHITSRLREIIFPVRPSFSNAVAPPYPPFQEMQPPPGSYPTEPFHPIDHQPAFSYGMERVGPPNLDRGPYPYSGEGLGHGPPFESSPRTWHPQPFSSGNPGGGVADVGSGMAARSGPLGSGSQAPSSTSTTIEIVIPVKLLSHVHGENNSNLGHIKQISGAKVRIHELNPGATEGVVVVSGTSEQVRAAQSLIHAFILCGETTP